MPKKRISNVDEKGSRTGLTYDKFAFERDDTATLKRKSQYVRSRLPTFGSLTTSKQLHHQGSKVDVHRRSVHDTLAVCGGVGHHERAGLT